MKKEKETVEDLEHERLKKLVVKAYDNHIKVQKKKDRVDHITYGLVAAFYVSAIVLFAVDQSWDNMLLTIASFMWVVIVWFMSLRNNQLASINHLNKDLRDIEHEEALRAIRKFGKDK